jgi:hypothetical protein
MDAMTTFREIFDRTRSENGWDSRQTAEHFASMLEKSVATIYRYLEGRIPADTLKLVQLTTRPSIADSIKGILKR